MILLLQVFLAMGLKYLWNIMNLLQFLIYMQMWLISLPPTTRIILRELKTLALLEFIPTDKFRETLKQLMGIKEDKEENCEEGDICQSSTEE